MNTLGTIDEMKYVVSISLQPGSGGNILATADLFDSALRIFDVRRSRSSEFEFSCHTDDNCSLIIQTL